MKGMVGRYCCRPYIYWTGKSSTTHRTSAQPGDFALRAEQSSSSAGDGLGTSSHTRALTNDGVQEGRDGPRKGSPSHDQGTYRERTRPRFGSFQNELGRCHGLHQLSHLIEGGLNPPQPHHFPPIHSYCSSKHQHVVEGSVGEGSGGWGSCAYTR